MTHHEKLMYRIPGNISNSNAPIIFKGALITKLALEENGYKELERATNDIDGKLKGIDGKPLFDKVYRYLNDFLRSFIDVDKMNN